jgi:hypothetical protein
MTRFISAGALSSLYQPRTAPPGNTVAPVLSVIIGGAVAVGSTLGVTPGTWSGSPTLSRQWRRGTANIPGATGTSYVLTNLDVGALIDCAVTGTNAAGSETALSNALGPVGP